MRQSATKNVHEIAAHLPKGRGRPKIDGLVSVNLRIVRSDLECLDGMVAALRVSRSDPALNRTDILREIIAAALQR